MKISYTAEDCSRCTGTGSFGPLAVDNGRCFDCRGKGRVMTREGRDAKLIVDAYRDTHMTVAASTLRPGDKIVTNDGARRTVVDVETTLGQGMYGSSRSGVPGTESYVETWQLGKTTLRTRKWAMQFPAHEPVALAWTTAHLEAAARLVVDHEGAQITW